MANRLLLPLKDVVSIHGMDILKHANNVTKRYGISTGYDSIDGFFRGGGLLPGLTYSIGGRPGIGKSQFLLNILYNIACTGKPVALFSLELTKERVLERPAYMIAGIDYLYHFQAQQEMSKEELDGLEQTLYDLQKLPFYIRDTVRLTPTIVKQTLERERALGVEVVAIDYLHIMGLETASFNRERQIGTIVETVRDTTKQLGMACLLACQLNREVEINAPYTPSLANFRDSGAIEQVSFSVMALYRQDYYSLAGKFNEQEHDFIGWNPDGSPVMTGKMDVLVLKNQDGMTGKATVKFNAPTGRISK